MAHGDAREGKWRGNWRTQWVASTLRTTSEHGVSNITTADAHTSAASSPLNWRPPADLNGLGPFRAKDEIWFLRMCHRISNAVYMLWVCVCSLRYPTRNGHAPYCHLWPAPLYNIFPHYLINNTVFEKKLLNTKCVLWLSVQLLSETFLILRRTERDIIKNVYRSSCTVTFIHVRF